MNKIFDNWITLLYFVIILLVIIFSLIGFLLGYYYTDKSCIENPLSYGLKKINKMNKINLTCSCFSYDGKTNPFSFDEYGIKE